MKPFILAVLSLSFVILFAVLYDIQHDGTAHKKCTVVRDGLDVARVPGQSEVVAVPVYCPAGTIPMQPACRTMRGTGSSSHLNAFAIQADTGLGWMCEWQVACDSADPCTTTRVETVVLCCPG